MKVFKVDALKSKKEYSNLNGKLTVHTAFETVEQELKIIKKLKHPNIIQFKEILYHTDKSRIFLGAALNSDGVC